MTRTPEKMSGASLDIAVDKRERLKQLFPTVFTETVDATGELVESVDFEKLKAELGAFSDFFESRREHYGMDWPGKKEAIKLIQTVSTATLKPCREESVMFDTTENLFIEGDNLEVLKLLQKSYYGKVKMIYIDPPYNTGNEFIYPDNFSETLETYLEYAGLVDGEGKKFSTNTANEGRFHTKWLNMMYPRLYLARNLLQDDGLIFISISDHEVCSLKFLLNELFGEENFCAQFVWKSRKFPDSRAKTGISTDHEYIFCYAKSEMGVFRGIERDETKFSNPDDDPRGPWMSRSLLGLATKTQRPNLHYPIIDPSSSRTYLPPDDTGWRYSSDRMNALIETGCIMFPSKANGRPREKKFRADLQSEYVAFPSIIDDVFTSDGTTEIRTLFGEGLFDFSKPPDLLSRLIKQAAGSDGIIMDFFAGSCTTAHATFDLNMKDGGRRKFIMVQLPQPCDENTEAFKAGYKTIADIGKERIRRVIKKLEAEQSGKLPFDDASTQDRGFKVLKLDKSNFKQWQPLPPDTASETLVKQLKLFIDHIDPKAKPEDLLYEILIKAGFPPSEKIETLTLAGKTVYSIAGGGLLLCLEEEISAELINSVAEAEPMQFICMDAAFGGNDQLKANAVQTFSSRNMGKEKHNQIVFKTV